MQVKPYSGTPGRPRAVIVDIDGTVALRGDRGPYEFQRVFEDAPNRPVIHLVRMFRQQNYCILFVSGREDSCRELTRHWLSDYVITFTGPERLHMRRAGDGRPDYEVKDEIFEQYFRDWYDVRYVIDDRNSVVAMWRAKGLTCLQVADGPF